MVIDGFTTTVPLPFHLSQFPTPRLEPLAIQNLDINPTGPSTLKFGLTVP